MEVVQVIDCRVGLVRVERVTLWMDGVREQLADGDGIGGDGLGQEGVLDHCCGARAWCRFICCDVLEESRGTSSLRSTGREGQGGRVAG